MNNFIGSRALPAIHYHRPRDMDTLLRLTGTLTKKIKIVAGCTDFIPAVRSGKWAFKDGLQVIDICGVRELAGVRREGDWLVIGAATRLADVAGSRLVQEHAALLAETIAQMASPQVRNIATIGGNLATASPAADSVPPLFCLDAQVTIRSPESATNVPLTDFFSGPGATRLTARDLLTEIRFPVLTADDTASRIRMGLRTAFVCSIIAVATRLRWNGPTISDARIAMGAVAPTPIRLKKAEDVLVGTNGNANVIAEAARIAAAGVTPVSDLRAGAEYRRAMAATLTRRLLSRCTAK